MKHTSWLLLLSLIGLIVAFASLSAHYEEGSSFCTISETFNCDAVNKGPYSEIVGIPVALLGVLGYLAFGILVWREKSIRKFLVFTKKDYAIYLLGFAGVMLLFSLYLTALEVFVIHAYCILCLISQATVLALFLVTLHKWLRAPQ